MPNVVLLACDEAARGLDVEALGVLPETMSLVMLTLSNRDLVVVFLAASLFLAVSHSEPSLNALYVATEPRRHARFGGSIDERDLRHGP